MVSHDLRTPMTSIKGYAALMLEKLKQLDEDRQARYLGIIVKESDRLTRLINDLLDLQRLEAGRMQFNFEPVDLVKLVRDACDSFSGAALAKQQTLRSRLPEREIMVMADADRLSQVAANLLSNATKFTPEQGEITLAMETLNWDGREAVKVSVTDSGPGIPKEMQGKLFSKFQQIDNVPKEKQKGSGLGLALVREIVEHHHGKVGLESETGQGARFYFLLPIAK
jgi:signal transduction histidine kinase